MTMIELLQEMKQKMESLQNKVGEMQQQQQQQQRTPSSSGQEFEEDDDITGNLVELLESTKSFLEAAFSVTVANSDRKKRLDRIGVPEYDANRCPKLDPMV